MNKKSDLVISIKHVNGVIKYTHNKNWPFVIFSLFFTEKKDPFFSFIIQHFDSLMQQVNILET